MNRTIRHTLTATAVAALVLAGCSSEETESTASESATVEATESTESSETSSEATEATSEATSESTEASGDTDLNDGEPIVAAIETSYPPIGFVDPESGDNVGFLVDLLRAIEAELGVPIEFVESEFEQLIPSVRTGRIDVIAGGMTDTEERRELVDFVDYIATGPQPFAVADADGDFETVEDLCGQEVGTPSFTNYVAQLEALSEEICPEDAPITVVGTEGAGATLTQMEQGRRAVGVLGAEYVAHLVAELEPDNYVKFGEPFSEDYFGIGFSQDNPDLRDAFAEALDVVIEDGTYDALLSDWSMEDLVIDQVRVNGEPA